MANLGLATQQIRVDRKGVVAKIAMETQPPYVVMALGLYIRKKP